MKLKLAPLVKLALLSVLVAACSNQVTFKKANEKIVPNPNNDIVEDKEVLKANPEVIINDGNKFLTQNTFNIELEDIGASEVAISFSPNCEKNFEPFENKKILSVNIPNSKIFLSVQYRRDDEETECNTQSITHDDLAPNLTFNLTPSALAGSRTANFIIDSSDAGSAIDFLECQNSPNSAWVTCNQDVVLENLSEGENIFSVRAFDKAGNQSSVSYNWIIDVSAPNIQLIDMPDANTNLDSAQFLFTSSDPNGLDRLECDLDRTGFAPCNNTFMAAQLPPGGHELQIRAVDLAGNVSSPTIYNWFVDLTDPTLVLETTLGGQSTSRIIEWDFSFHDGNASVNSGIERHECRLDSGNFTPCVAPFVTQALPFGPHRIEIRTFDKAGNFSEIFYDWNVGEGHTGDGHTHGEHTGEGM